MLGYASICTTLSRQRTIKVLPTEHTVKTLVRLCGSESGWVHISFEPGHEKMCLMSYANNKGTDQSAHLGSLISTFVVRCLDSTISLDSIAEISRL